MEFITSWVQGIIVAVVIGTIIEMILPNGNSKKYIKVVIGVYIIFNILTPIISKFTGSEIKLNSIIDISKYEEQISTYETSTKDLQNNNEESIKQVYILNLKKDMKAKVEDKGYIVNSIYIQIEDNEEYSIKNVNIIVNKKQNVEAKTNTQNEIVNEIEKVNIQIKVTNETNIKQENEASKLTNKEIEELKDYISSTYEINKKNIKVN